MGTLRNAASLFLCLFTRGRASGYNPTVKEEPVLRQIAKASMVGVHLVVATFVGLAIGYGLDVFFGTKPWLTLIFLFLGIATGFRDLFKMTKFNDDNDEDAEPEDEQKDGPEDE